MRFLFRRILFHRPLQTYSVSTEWHRSVDEICRFYLDLHITSRVSYLYDFQTHTISFLQFISLNLLFLFFFVLHHFSSDFCLNTRSIPVYLYWKQIISFSRAPSLVNFQQVRPKTGIYDIRRWSRECVKSSLSDQDEVNWKPESVT